MDPFQSLEVVNRRAVPYETMFDGRCIVFKPFEKKSYPQHVARNIVEQSNMKIHLASGVPRAYALGITGDKHFVTTPLEGDIAKEQPLEVLDRTDGEVLTETEPKALTEEGEEALGVGKKEKRRTPPPAEMKPKEFHNADVRTGPQNGGSFEGRISTKNA